MICGVFTATQPQLTSPDDPHSFDKAPSSPERLPGYRWCFDKLPSSWTSPAICSGLIRFPTAQTSWFIHISHRSSIIYGVIVTIVVDLRQLENAHFALQFIVTIIRSLENALFGTCGAIITAQSCSPIEIQDVSPEGISNTPTTSSAKPRHCGFLSDAIGQRATKTGTKQEMEQDMSQNPTIVAQDREPNPDRERICNGYWIRHGVTGPRSDGTPSNHRSMRVHPMHTHNLVCIHFRRLTRTDKQRLRVLSWIREVCGLSSSIPLVHGHMHILQWRAGTPSCRQRLSCKQKTCISRQQCSHRDSSCSLHDPPRYERTWWRDPTREFRTSCMSKSSIPACCRCEMARYTRPLPCVVLVFSQLMKKDRKIMSAGLWESGHLACVASFRLHAVQRLVYEGTNGRLGWFTKHLTTNLIIRLNNNMFALNDDHLCRRIASKVVVPVSVDNASAMEVVLFTTEISFRKRHWGKLLCMVLEMVASHEVCCIRGACIHLHNGWTTSHMPYFLLLLIS